MVDTTTLNAWYCTREQVMRASDIKAAAYLSGEIDRAIESASRAVDDLCHVAGFAPWKGPLTFDWPSQTSNNEESFQFYLGQYGLLELTTATSGGTAITVNSYGGPTQYGPPFTRLYVARSSSSYLDSGTSSGQRSMVIDGLWANASLRETGNPSWMLSGNPNASTTSVVLNAPLGVGNVVKIDSERLIVTDKSWTTSGQTGSLAASNAAQSLAVSDGTVFFAGEELILDSERVLVQDITGNTLLVKRAVGGSVLAVHTTASIFWARTCTVTRGALGTTAASHAAGALVLRWEPPGLVNQLTIALALDQRAQESSAYARTIGTGDSERNAAGGGIRDLSKRVYAAYGRKARIRSV